MKLVPERRTLILSILSASVTFILMLGEHLYGGSQKPLIFHLNDKMIMEALSVSHAVPMIVVAMLFGLLAIVLAMMLESDETKMECVSKLKKALDLEKEISGSFPPDKWLNTPDGVAIFSWLSDMALLKVGVSITSTVVGAVFYLKVRDLLSWWVCAGAILTAYILSIFQNFVVWKLEKTLTTKAEI